MMRLARLLPLVCIGTVLWAFCGSSRAAQAPATQPAAAAAAAPAPDPQLVRLAEDFWHYASIARYELAKATGEKIISANADPMAVLRAFEAMVAERNRLVPSDRRVELYERLLSWQRVPELKEVSAQLVTIFNKAKTTRRAEPAFIEQNIERLNVNQRAYQLAVEQLRQSGELAVPVMIAYLKDPAKRPLHIAIRSAMRDLGIKALNPLVAVTESKDWDLMPWVCSVLGDLGYDNAVPYLVKLVQAQDTPETIKSAANEALLRLNVPNGRELNAAQLFYELAERFYYDKASIAADPGASVAYVWTWSGQNLAKVDVPAAVFNEDMTLRSCESALKLNSNLGEAVSLWLAAGYKREVELPEGAIDPVWPEGHPNTHYYAVCAGAQLLSPALARGLRDHNGPVALKAIKSLQEIAGASSLFADVDQNPIMDAMLYPDRQVRFEAAFTVALAVPQRQFSAQDRVVPILAEALGQTGKPGLLIVGRTQDEVAALKEKLGQSYAIAGATTADAAVAASAGMSGVDVIIINEDNPTIDRLFAATRENMRLGRAGILVRAASEVASPYAAVAATNPLVSVTAASNDNIAAPVENARKRAGGLPIDEKVATAYALRSAELLARLALSRGQVLDLGAAQSAVLSALDDARPEVIRAAGQVLAYANFRDAQAGLLTKALDAKTPDELKIALLNDLANNAKFFGNRLDGSRVDALTQFVAGASAQPVRSAAAEAHGALNLPPEQAKRLILEQSKR